MDNILDQAARYGAQITDLWKRGMTVEAFQIMRAWHVFSDQFQGSSNFYEVCAAYWDASAVEY